MKPVVVCGLGRFGLQVVEELTTAGVPVVVVTDHRTADDRRERAVALAARVVDGDFRQARVRRDAGIASCAGVILTGSSDVDNLETALEIRGETPAIRIVMRHSEPRLARRLEQDFGITSVLAPAVLAADAFVDASLSAPLAPGPATPRNGRLEIPRRPLRPEIAVIPGLLLALFLIGIALFHRFLGLSWLDASYFASTIVTTVGFGDINLSSAPPTVKLFGIGMMFGGIVLIAMLSSLLTHFVVSGGADRRRNESWAHRLHNHVVVCGYGRVGEAVVDGLRRRGVPVVVVDSGMDLDPLTGDPLPFPVIRGDATAPIVLLRAGLDRARAVVVCTSNDALNIEIGLAAQSLNEERRPARPLRVVLRCFEAILAQRIHAVSGNYTLLSEAQLAAPEFCRLILSQESSP